MEEIMLGSDEEIKRESFETREKRMSEWFNFGGDKRGMSTTEDV